MTNHTSSGRSGRAGSGPQPPVVVTRRQLLSMLGVTGASLLVPSALGIGDGTAAAAAKSKKTAKPTVKRTTTAPTGPKLVAATGGGAGPNVLVVIELQGGNDGFSMLVPTGDGRFRQLRNKIWFDPKQLTDFDDATSISAGLAPLRSQLAFIEGVGVPKPDLSHTAMMQRWWRGDMDAYSAGRTGFLGRCCDLLGESGSITGVSIGGGATPALINERGTTAALPDASSLQELLSDKDERMRPTLSALSKGGADGTGLETVDGDLLAKARGAIASGQALINGLGRVGGGNDAAKAAGYSDDQLARSLAFSRQLISLGTGVRVIHVPWGSFDTHTNHRYSHPDQMRILGSALVAFHNDLARNGLSNRVLVATTSEFGRRPEANAGGTDHGTASTMALMGPVRAGRHGVPVNFNQLDQAGNVAATVAMTDYYATLSSWLGVPPSASLSQPGTVLSSVGIATAS
jgi:uncharacterized protein (DUF1501 family)